MRCYILQLKGLRSRGTPCCDYSRARIRSYLASSPGLRPLLLKARDCPTFIIIPMQGSGNPCMAVIMKFTSKD